MSAWRIRNAITSILSRVREHFPDEYKKIATSNIDYLRNIKEKEMQMTHQIK